VEQKTLHSGCILYIVFGSSSVTTGCPTRYRTRHFFNNFTTNEDIATKFEADLPRCVRNFSHNERTPVQISLQYLNWC